MKFAWVILLLLAVSIVTGTEPEIECSSEPVAAVCSESVVLRCHLSPPLDASQDTVKWSRGSDVVHFHGRGNDHPEEQRETFEGRTSLSSGLSKGNLSLSLSSLKLTDSGRYECSFLSASPEKSCNVNVSVGESEVIGSHVPVSAQLGQQVVLPCHLEPPFDVSALTVEWKFNKMTVYSYRSGADHEDAQEDRFKNRTSLFPDEMHRGNISLRLSNVSTDDEGNYTCFVPNLQCQVKKGNVTLMVDDVNSRKVNKTTGDDPGTGNNKEVHSTGFYVGFACLIIGLIIIGLIIFVWKRPGCLGPNRQQNSNPPNAGNHEMEDLNAGRVEQDGNNQQDGNSGEREALNEPNQQPNDD